VRDHFSPGGFGSRSVPAHPGGLNAILTSVPIFSVQATQCLHSPADTDRFIYPVSIVMYINKHLQHINKYIVLVAMEIPMSDVFSYLLKTSTLAHERFL